MTDMHIDRLALKLSGISEDDGQRLARLIAEGLASSSITLEGTHYLDTMRVNITAGPGSRMDVLSKQVVAAVLQQLQHTL
jgi:hypothetical protein